MTREEFEHLQSSQVLAHGDRSRELSHTNRAVDIYMPAALVSSDIAQQILG